MANPTVPVTSSPQGGVQTDTKAKALVPKRPALNFPIFKIIIYILLTLGAFLFISPFLWMLSTSLMIPSEIAAGQFVPSSKLVGMDAVSEEDWSRLLSDFLSPKADVDFNGNSIELFYTATPDGGAFDLYIDGQYLGFFDTYSETVMPNQSVLVDSYPEVPTLSLTQTVQLPDARHTLTIEFNDAESRGRNLLIEQAVARDSDNAETVLGTEQFELLVGQWIGIAADSETQIIFNHDNKEWELNGEAFEDISQLTLNANALIFPEYLEDCCRTRIEASLRLQDMPQSEFIRLERQSGSHSSLTTDFIPFGIADALGIEDRYVVTGSFSHYVKVWTDSGFSGFFVNSVIITVVTVFFQTLVSIMAAYAFAQMEFPGRDLLFVAFILTLFIPFMVILIPNLLTVTTLSKWSAENIGPIFDSIGNVTGTIPIIGKPNASQAVWLDNLPALVIPFLASTFSIFLLRQFFMQIPSDLWDAARIDGAGHIRFLFQIVVPISRAAITTVVIFSSIGTWNSLEWPILVTTSEEWRPIAYALYDFRGEEGNDPQLLMAGAMIALLPIIIMYLIAQRQFTEGIATTGLKG